MGAEDSTAFEQRIAHRAGHDDDCAALSRMFNEGIKLQLSDRSWFPE